MDRRLQLVIDAVSGRWSSSSQWLFLLACSLLLASNSQNAVAELPGWGSAFPRTDQNESSVGSIEQIGANVERPWVTIGQSQSSKLRLIAEEAEVAGPQTLFQWSYGAAGPVTSKLDEPLKTDRPDFTEASTTVGKGVLQIEMGYTYTHDSENGSTSIEQSFGEPLFRYGMFADWFELRVGLRPIHVREISSTVRESTAGMDDLYLGVKLAITQQQGILPEIAFTPQMTIPTGSKAFTGGEVFPGVNLLYGWDITDQISFGGSTQYNHNLRDLNDYHVQYAQSFTLNYEFTETFGSYMEWFGLFPTYAVDAHSEQYFDGGLRFLVTDDLQFDVRAGVGLNAAAADYFVGTGFSIRLH